MWKEQQDFTDYIQEHEFKMCKATPKKILRQSLMDIEGSEHTVDVRIWTHPGEFVAISLFDLNFRLANF